MGETNAELARRGYEAAARGDLGVIFELLDPAVRWHAGDPSAPGACEGRAEAMEYMRRALSGGGLGELVDVIDAGERVVVIMRPAGESGEPGATSANLTTFRDGRAIEMVHYPDPQDALAAAGL